MIKRLLFKSTELIAVCAMSVVVTLVLTGGAKTDLQAGTTPGGDPCATGATLGSFTNMAGDADGNGTLSLSDPLRILEFMFNGGAAPVQMCAAGGGDLPFTDEEIERLDEFLEHMEMVDLTYEDEDYRTIRFHGVNVQIVNGLGATNGYPSDPYSSSSAFTEVNGLGNLIVGYNEIRTTGSDPDLPDNVHTGSHNLVVGARHNYDSFGGLVAGRANWSAGPYATCPGGYLNMAEGFCSTSSGGCLNFAVGAYSHTTGGRRNLAESNFSVVVGGGGPDEGDGNIAQNPEDPYPDGDGRYTVVVGGRQNIANATASVVVGGTFNVANGVFSTVLGGGAPGAADGNEALGVRSVICGGCSNDAVGSFSVVSGGRFNTSGGDWSVCVGGGGETSVAGNAANELHSVVVGGRTNLADSDVDNEAMVVVGGQYNVASGLLSTILGGGAPVSDEGNTASGTRSSICGGCANTTSAENAVVAGGRHNTASGSWSVVSGGGGLTSDVGNTASGAYSSVSGGRTNVAEEEATSVSGGLEGTAADIFDWIGGDSASSDE